ncbi:hypothetical protein PQX77_006586 [Marasmius sp. AFHP31]|nr:hypothetical protein PQX77_006586 [Marasmius sp. AFHP31]
MPRKRIYHSPEERRLANNAKAKRWRDRNLDFIKEQREAKKKQEQEARIQEIRRKRQRALKRAEKEAGRQPILRPPVPPTSTYSFGGAATTVASIAALPSSTPPPAPSPTTSNVTCPSPSSPTTSNAISTSSLLFEEASIRYTVFTRSFRDTAAKVSYLEEMYQTFRTPIAGEGYWIPDEFFGPALLPFRQIQVHLTRIEKQILASDGKTEEWRQVGCFIDDVSNMIDWIEDLQYWSDSIIEMDLAHRDRELKYRRQ